MSEHKEISYTAQERSQKIKEWSTAWSFKPEESTVPWALFSTYDNYTMSSDEIQENKYGVLYLRIKNNRLQFQKGVWQQNSLPLKSTEEWSDVFPHNLNYISLSMPYKPKDIWELYNNMGLEQELAQTIHLSFLESMLPETARAAEVIWARTQGNWTLNLTYLRFLLCLDLNPEDQDINIKTAMLYRAQFAIVNPVFAPVFIELEKQWNQIDLGKSSLEILSENYNCSHEVIRVINAGIPGDLNLAKTVLSESCLKLLSHMPNSWLQEFRVATEEVWNFLITASRVIGTNESDKFYQRIAEKLNPGTACKNIIALNKLNAFSHYNDLIQNMARELLMPVIARYHPGENIAVLSTKTHMAACKLMLWGGLKNTVTSCSIHLNGEIHEAALGRPAETFNVWPEPAKPVQAPNGLTVRFLTSQAELNNEGIKMMHCVASYGERCMQRVSAILSLGEWVENQWNPRSTVELKLVENVGEKHFQVSQHFSKKNNPPDQKSKDAINWWIKLARKGEIQVNTHGFLAEKNHWNVFNETVENYLERHLGENWKSSASYQHRWDRWRRIIGSRANLLSGWLETIDSSAVQSKNFDASILDILRIESKRYEADENSISDDPVKSSFPEMR